MPDEANEAEDQVYPICPLSMLGGVKSPCDGAGCAWWVEGRGLPGRCAIAQMARHHVIADMFDVPDYFSVEDK